MLWGRGSALPRLATTHEPTITTAPECGMVLE